MCETLQSCCEGTRAHCASPLSKSKTFDLHKAENFDVYFLIEMSTYFAKSLIPCLDVFISRPFDGRSFEYAR